MTSFPNFVSEKENGIWNEGAGERELSAEKI
jgi:hypothetical protein